MTANAHFNTPAYALIVEIVPVTLLGRVGVSNKGRVNIH